MAEEHVTLRMLIAYITRNERPRGDIDTEVVERHLAGCALCRQEYDRMRARYDALGDMKNPAEHQKKLFRAWKRRQRIRKSSVYSLSGLLFAGILFMALSGIINYFYDQGDRGLAELMQDYEFAVKKEYYRGGGEMFTGTDIELYKRAVIILFDARQYEYTFPAGYDMEKVMKSDSLLTQAYSITSDKILKRRITILKNKIQKIHGR